MEYRSAIDKSVTRAEPIFQADLPSWFGPVGPKPHGT